MEVLLMAVMGAANIVCFIVGAKVGQAVSRGEPVQLPKADPVAAIRENQERKAGQAEQERREIILRNIENYDGTGFRQEDVPGR